MIQALNPDKIQADAGSYIDWLDRQAEVDTTRKIGTQGYCMGGPYTVFAAHARPARIGAAVSCHGANLVNEHGAEPAQAAGADASLVHLRHRPERRCAQPRRQDRAQGRRRRCRPPG
jgi:dienelactone hydrolase